MGTRRSPRFPPSFLLLPLCAGLQALMPGDPGPASSSSERVAAIFRAADRDRDGALSFPEIQAFQASLDRSFRYQTNDTCLRPEEFLEQGGGDCEDWSCFSAEMMLSHGRDARVAGLYSPGYLIGHAIALVKVDPPVSPTSWVIRHPDENGSNRIWLPVDYDVVGWVVTRPGGPRSDRAFSDEEIAELFPPKKQNEEEDDDPLGAWKPRPMPSASMPGFDMFGRPIDPRWVRISEPGKTPPENDPPEEEDDDPIRTFQTVDRQADRKKDDRKWIDRFIANLPPLPPIPSISTPPRPRPPAGPQWFIDEIAFPSAWYGKPM